MRRNPLVAVFDIETAIAGIVESTKDKTFAAFHSDWLLRHGVQRGIEIISEAARRLPPEVLAFHPDIPWPKIRAVGNILRHEYQSVSDEIIWSVVQNDLPELRRVMAEIRVRLEAGLE
ncbi:HepT-like ribonuclease domain-containing protein [Bosea vaviloviae]|nr:HepT-like ribonuclease domain-containing protein [Bosea vaviloviae]